MPAFTVTSAHGRYHVVKDGKRASADFATRWMAEDRAEVLERKAQIRRRPCITCAKPFTSEGPHNRMCKSCRATAHSEYV